MSICLDTYLPRTRSSFKTDFGSNLYYPYLVGKQTIETVILNFYERDELVSVFSDEDLTLLAMESSENSFAELWDLENDDYWCSYLND